MTDYWDCTDTPDYENFQRILAYLNRLEAVPRPALTALEHLCDLAYPAAKTTFRCRICGEQIVIPKLPGKRPTSLCKKSDCQRAANRQRVAKHRAAHPTASS
jgi:hypothetical protein